MKSSAVVLRPGSFGCKEPAQAVSDQGEIAVQAPEPGCELSGPGSATQ